MRKKNVWVKKNLGKNLEGEKKVVPLGQLVDGCEMIGMDLASG